MRTSPDSDALAEIRRLTAFVPPLRAALSAAVVGQDDLLDALLTGLLAGGHVLVEGVPGLAKTLAVRTLAAAVGGSFRRIQFTPDLLPADVTGSLFFNAETGALTVRRGPVFANVVLADEINRAPAKVQSALLEAMQERHVTIAGETHALPEPFFVMATQNPIEQAGTYPLPEAQLDRFLLRALVRYPARVHERAVITRPVPIGPPPAVPPVTDPQTVRQSRAALDLVHVDGRLTEYILDVVIATRPGEDRELSALQDRSAVASRSALLEYGASPRAAQALALAAKCRAVLAGRAHVLPQDVKDMAVPVLAHRVVPAFEAEAEGMDAIAVIGAILGTVRVP